MKRISLIMIALLTVSSVPAQDYQSYFEEFDVVLYQLQVNVRDRDGNHIPGLTKEDFQLLLEGKGQELETVEEINAGAWANAPADKPIPQQARRLFVLLFDLKYTTKQGALEARDSARSFLLEQLNPTDLVSVFSFDPLKGFAMITNFTSDQEHLLKAVDWLGLEDTQNVVQGPSGYFYNSRIDELQGELTSLEGNFSDPTGVDTGTGGQGLGTGFDKADALNHLIEISDMGRRAEQKIYQREVSSFMNSFEKFANGLRMIRGRKNLVWFSTGFDARSITGGTTAELQRNQSLIENGQHYNVSADQFGVASIQHEAQELIDQLQSSGTVIFAVDTSLNGDSTTDKPGSHILNMFAEDTGGKAYHSYSDLSKPLDRIQELTNDYYVLSFYPNVEMKKGDIGKVKVKVNNNRRARIYTTKGIMVEPDFTKLSRIEKQIHLSEYIGRDVVVSGIPTQVETFQVPVNKNLVKLNVSVELRGDYFLGHKKPRPIEVHTLAISESGELFDRAYFNFQIDPEKTRTVLDKTGVKYFANVFLKPGKYKLKVVARDLETGKVGSSINNINVEDNYDSIHGPTHITEERWVLVRESERSERARRLDKLDHSYPFSVGGSDLVPSSMELISSEEPQSFFYTLSGDASVKETPPNVTALVMDKDGKIMPIPASAMSADAEFVGGPRHVMNFLLKVDLPSMGLKSGESYKLMTQFKTSGGAALRSAADFTLE